MESPFGVAPVLVAALGPGGVWVHFDVTGVDHQPCKVGLLHEWLPPCFPDTLVRPAAEAARRVFQSPSAGGQSRHGAPGRKVQNTALRKRRWSCAIPPHAPSRPGK